MSEEETQEMPNVEKALKHRDKEWITIFMLVIGVIFIMTALYLFIPIPEKTMNGIEKENDTELTELKESSEIEFNELEPTTNITPLKTEYWAERYQPNREEYNIEEKAKAYFQEQVNYYEQAIKSMKEELPLLEKEYSENKSQETLNKMNYYKELLSEGQFPAYLSFYKAFQDNPLQSINLSSEEEIWKALPSIPSDFGEKVNYLRTTLEYNYLTELSEEYWKQPEFIPFRGGQVLEVMEEKWVEIPPYPREGTSITVYPRQQHAIIEKGITAKTSFLLANEFLSEYYRGIKLNHSVKGINSMDYDLSTGTTTIKETDSQVNAGNYITVNITPNEFLLTPCYPRFTEGWVQKINIEIEVAEDTPTGLYQITLSPGTPSQHNEWKKQYLLKYSLGWNPLISTEYSNIYIEVIE